MYVHQLNANLHNFADILPRTESKFVFLNSPGINSKEFIPSAYVVWQAGTSNGVVAPVSIPGLLKHLQIRAVFLAP
jgi:hypothetical protein